MRDAATWIHAWRSLSRSTLATVVLAAAGDIANQSANPGATTLDAASMLRVALAVVSQGLDDAAIANATMAALIDHSNELGLERGQTRGNANISGS